MNKTLINLDVTNFNILINICFVRFKIILLPQVLLLRERFKMITKFNPLSFASIKGTAKLNSYPEKSVRFDVPDDRKLIVASASSGCDRPKMQLYGANGVDFTDVFDSVHIDKIDGESRLLVHDNANVSIDKVDNGSISQFEIARTTIGNFINSRMNLEQGTGTTITNVTESNLLANGHSYVIAHKFDKSSIIAEDRPTVTLKEVNDSKVMQFKDGSDASLGSLKNSDVTFDLDSSYPKPTITSADKDSKITVWKDTNLEIKDFAGQLTQYDMTSNGSVRIGILRETANVEQADSAKASSLIIGIKEKGAKVKFASVIDSIRNIIR
jgi:hypothetical protein